jgi:hypothetical protein
VTPSDFVQMLSAPVPLQTSAEFGLALSPYMHRGSQTSLGVLVDAYRHQGHQEAGDVLSLILERWIQRHQIHFQYDFMTTVPAAFNSGPRYDSESLLCEPGRHFALRVAKPVWRRTAASPEPSWVAAYAQPPFISSQGVTVDVAGRKILVVQMCASRPDEELSRGIHELYARAAARVGVLAFCSNTGDLHGR